MRLHYYAGGLEIPAYHGVRIAGQVADTAVKTSPGVVHSVTVGIAGAASSLVEIYDGPVSGTPVVTLRGTDVFVQHMHGYFENSIHVKTTDSGGAMRVMVHYL